MRLNRAWERLRLLDEMGRRLRRRAGARRERTPVVLVPSILGTRLCDARGRSLWGALPRLFHGPSIAGARDVRPAGLLEGFTLAPGLVSYDVYGGLVRLLEDVGGYRRGEDLSILDYDWRLGLEHAAERLGELVDRLRGAGEERIDLIGVSTGGLTIRVFLARGGAAAVRRVVHVGTPQRGIFSAITNLVEGVRVLPLGKRFAADAEVGRYQTVWDVLPHPDETVFVDAEGRPLAAPLHDPATWSRLGLRELDQAEADRLERAARLWRLLDERAPAHEAWAIGARHLPTLARLPVVDGRAEVPACSPRKGDRRAAFLFEPGDSSLGASSLVHGLDPARVRWVRPRLHRLLPSDPSVHRLVLEALVDVTPASASAPR